MRQHAFESQHRAFWQEFEATLNKVEIKKNLAPKHNHLFGQNYRTMCHHLALANSRNYSAGLCLKLQGLVDRAHRQLYQHKTPILSRFQEFCHTTFPHTVRQEKTVVLWGHLLFYVPFLVCYLLALGNPDFFDQLAGQGAGREMGNSYSEMASLQEAHASRPWGQNWLMFGFYIFNNISIGFQSLVGGVVLGLGSAYIAVYNGAVIGAAMGYMTTHPAGPVFFSFVGAHGAFELTGIVLAVASGLKIGYALINPGPYSRRDALKIQSQPATVLICGAFLFLFIAALIEGFWSPLTVLPLWLKYTVALLLWLGVYGYLFVYQAHFHAVKNFKRRLQ